MSSTIIGKSAGIIVNNQEEILVLKGRYQRYHTLPKVSLRSNESPSDRLTKEITDLTEIDSLVMYLAGVQTSESALYTAFLGAGNGDLSKSSELSEAFWWNGTQEVNLDRDSVLLLKLGRYYVGGISRQVWKLDHLDRSRILNRIVRLAQEGGSEYAS